MGLTGMGQSVSTGSDADIVEVPATPNPLTSQQMSDLI